MSPGILRTSSSTAQLHPSPSRSGNRRRGAPRGSTPRPAASNRPIPPPFATPLPPLNSTRPPFQTPSYDTFFINLTSTRTFTPTPLRFPPSSNTSTPAPPSTPGAGPSSSRRNYIS
ncbi:hypothetical protein DFH09DRAFT_1371115 [Mycena vulgaris]|nr:hypothetical protein DFH09DRAFT_1371115 [Mycena vulgaris]